MIESIKEQIKIGDPPETKETYDRLLAEGYQEEKVYEMLASVLLAEMQDILTESRMFNRERYVKRLKQLPRLP